MIRSDFVGESDFFIPPMEAGIFYPPPNDFQIFTP